MNYKHFENKYIQIDELFFKTGKIEDSIDCAGYLIEVKDYFGNEKETLHDIRKFDGVYTGYIDYSYFTSFVEIEESFFFDQFAQYLNKIVDDHKSTRFEAFTIYFKSTPERRAHLSYLLMKD